MHPLEPRARRILSKLAESYPSPREKEEGGAALEVRCEQPDGAVAWGARISRLSVAGQFRVSLAGFTN